MFEDWGPVALGADRVRSRRMVMARAGLSTGYSVIELLFVLAVIAALSGMAIPQTLAALDGYRAYGAARYVSGRLYETRTTAVVRTANVGMRFIRSANSYTFAVYLDGNRNGVRTGEILGGVDREIYREERLSDLFPGVDFGALPGLPAVEAGSSPPGDDPIRFGSSNIAVFGALGTATPGSVYIRGRGEAQYAVRLLGQTGRIRILKFNPRTRVWRSL
jgi:hypothetical protein